MLDAILDATRDRVAALRPHAADLRDRARSAGPVRDLTAALAAPGLGVIAEIKRRSPSAGAIAPDLDPAEQARRYAAGGAVALSVLTEPRFFAGSLEDLGAARSAVSIPVLRKDFVIDPVQVWEARAAGADAVLLIVAALGDALLGELHAIAAELGLNALVEVHDEAEAQRALAIGARCVGVNNRDLATFRTDLAVAERLAPLVAPAAVRVAESGVSSPEGAARMAAAGYDAVLVGEAAVRSGDPTRFVRELAGG
jgi:indole-3-glycerol phosphate synthase